MEHTVSFFLPMKTKRWTKRARRLSQEVRYGRNNSTTSVDLQPQHLVGQPSFVMPEQVDPSLGYLTLYNTGTCHLALSTWHLALSTWHLAPGT
jgi:hypothetical protein